MAAEKQQQRYIAERMLVERARNGEGVAFDALFRAHKDGVYACLWHLLDGEADAVEDAVGAVFLSAFRGLAGFRMESSFATWLYRIAVNEARGRARRRRKQRLLGWFSLDGRSTECRALTGGPDPKENLLRDEETRMLRRAVRALPEPYRTPMVLRYMAGMDSPDIASVLRRPRGTVRYQLSRAIEILKERLGGEWME
jgi:RNA polymerase sigma-70 factor (ECF subfamily)